MLGVSEILSKVNSLPTREERINYLRENAGKPVQIVLQYALHPDIKWLVGPELPEFQANDLPGQETLLLAEARRLYLFVSSPGGEVPLTEAKRNVLFIQLLEMISAADVELIKHVINKVIPYEFIDYGLIYETWPGILPDASVSIETAEDRKVFTVDVGNLSPKTAEELIDNLMVKATAISVESTTEEKPKRKRKPKVEGEEKPKRTRKKKEDSEDTTEKPKKKRARARKKKDES